MKNKWGFVAFAITFFVLVFALGFKFYQSNERERLAKVTSGEGKLLIRDYSPQKGSSTPKVELVEFLDPECESCRMFHKVVKKFMKEYEGKIRVTIRYAPFHGNSRFAIKVLESARLQGKYWETLDILFKYQPYWGSHHAPKPELIWKILPEVGVDVEKVRADVSNPKFYTEIEQDVKDAVAAGVRATPSFFVNGKKLERFGEQYLRELIESEL